jgi:F-type H+-transporting ATPase subunit alpha
MDTVPINRIAEFELGLRDYLRTRQSDMLNQIRETGDLPDLETLDAAIENFKATFGEE